MGNDQSHLKGLEIEKKAIDVTDFWQIYSGELKNENSLTTSITIFQGEEVVTGQLWADKDPLQRATKNFKIYRHPSILRYVTSWRKGSIHYLATERCKPLSMVLASQNDTQICLGLRNILSALIFLSEKAKMCHLNVCAASIYVSGANGAWRLGGFEHLWSRAEINQTLLERSQAYRYKTAIDKDETNRNTLTGIESFAFGVLCEEILSSRKESLTIPFVNEFRKYCVENLRNANVNNRPTLPAILLHSYFNQDFIVIHLFLTELPLKTLKEKQLFFETLVDRLREFDEIVVATELIDLILSRMVLLNETAKSCVIPYILQPQIMHTETETSLPATASIFSPQIFTRFVVAKIQQLFLVRDIQIRLVLLEYFPTYIDYFPSKEVLSDQILPQLLLGIKDTNDELVAATLRCLADLVPVLGSSVVIGRNRGRIFSDGKPNGVTTEKDDCSSVNASIKWREARSITPVMNGAGLNTDFVSNTPLLTETASSVASIVNLQNSTAPNLMPERLSPDGGEDIRLSNERTDLEDDGWSDWETDAANEQPIQTLSENNVFDHNVNEIETMVSSDNSSPPNILKIISNSSSHNSNQNDDFIQDIKDIEIKITNSEADNEIYDFFKDMEPVIVTSNDILAALNDHQSGTDVPGLTKASWQQKNEADVKTTDFSEIGQDRFAVQTTSVDDENIEDTAWNDSGWDD